MTTAYENRLCTNFSFVLSALFRTSHKRKDKRKKEAEGLFENDRFIVLLFFD